MKFEAVCINSLEKIFPDQTELTGKINRISALLGETVSFQIACHCDQPYWLFAESDSEHVNIREVALAPAEFVASDDTSAILKKNPGLYPDPLMPLEKPARMPQNQWRSLWVTVKDEALNKAGKKQLRLK